jgi:methylglutaconyl-CoA hydratase
MDRGHVHSKTENGIATISFFHPQSNSLPGDLLRAMAQEITKAGNNSEAKVILLRSENESLPAGKAGVFCSGASFDELISIKDYETGKTFFSGFAAVINAMRKVPKFIIVRVQGKAVGGGVGLACSGDYTFATEAASVKLSELAIGIGAFVIGPAVERKVGKSAFSQLTMNATQWQSAHWAREKNLFAEVFPTAEEMDVAIDKLSDQLSKANPEAMMLLKKMMWEGTEHWDTLLIERAELSGRLVLSDFTRNAIEKFKAGAR